jgi:hypothetical protein
MKILIAMLALMTSVIANAQTTRIVTIDAFDFAYSGGLMLKNDNAEGSDREETTFRLNLNFAQSLEQYAGLMWKARAYINREDTEFGAFDYQETRWGGAGGLLYNFQPDNVKESFFASGMVGLERATYEIGNNDDESGFNIFTDLEIGKRFDMGAYSVANISYAPSLSLTFKRYGGDIRDEYFKSGSEMKINFLKFDILF